MIEYDKRIKDPSKILTPFSSGVNEYYGKECYFTDDLCNFCDLEVCIADTLVDRPLTNKDYQFTTEHDHFKYCLPSEFVEKPIKEQLRPYTLEEIQLEFEVGKPIKFRRKNNRTSENYLAYYLAYLGYSYLFDESEYKYYERIHIGNSSYTLQELFDNYEWQNDSNVWKPFGCKD